MIKESVELDDIPEELDMDENGSNHASNIFRDPDVCQWFIDHVVEPREWHLDHPDDVPPLTSMNIMSYQNEFAQNGLKLWDINNDPYSTVRLNLVSKTHPTRKANISGRADYLVTKQGLSRPESLSHVLCVIEKQSGGKLEVECEHQLETYLFLLMNKYGLLKLAGLLILNDGRCRAYKAVRGDDNGCVYFTNDTFNIFYMPQVVTNILTDLQVL